MIQEEKKDALQTLRAYRERLLGEIDALGDDEKVQMREPLRHLVQSLWRIQAMTEANGAYQASDEASDQAVEWMDLLDRVGGMDNE